MISQSLVGSTTDLLKQYHLTIATAESCTGGLLGHILTSVSGSSSYYDRGIISYTNQAKHELLHVPNELLVRYGAVSEPVAAKMAIGVRLNAKVDIGVSTTGIAGPTGGTKEKPVGLVYIGLSTEKDVIVKRFVFDGTRMENKDSTVTEALQLISEVINQMDL